MCQVAAIRADTPETCAVFGIALLLFMQYGVGGYFAPLDLTQNLLELPLARSPRPKNDQWPAMRTKVR